MANLQAITKSEFTKKSWQRNPNLLFAARDAVCLLGISEMPRAMMSMPIAFVRKDGEYSLVAVLGLEAESNLFVSTDGRWLGSYIPAAYRSYPFFLANSEAEEGQLVLCIDKDSGLLMEDDSAEPFFNEDGELSATVKEIVEFQSKVRAGWNASALICKSLLEHDLFKPWKLEDGTKRVEGLFSIDEAALRELSDEAYLELRQSGAIPVIYCQLLSMQRISQLTHFALAKSKAVLAARPSDLNLDGVDMGGNISFENL